ncbi:hypothetical protein niasHT_037176 [Heterodera trifolii]|uniref:PH domain-containing protein n=1 Tax=Heterodera trifolii TaxID=157864 RepID=A0ABD2HT92_9BILA
MENSSSQHLSDGAIPNGSLVDDRPIHWLASQLFKVEWNPLVENRRFKPMEGHLELFNEHVNGTDETWKRLYFRTKDGRFQWFASHCADEHPISDLLLTGTTISANKEAWTMQIRGGKEDANIVVRVPSNVFEKWHQALLSHASSSLVDAYIQPTWPPVPHRKNRVVLIELGRHAISAGVLTQKPSLPYSFFPTLCAVGSSNKNGQQKVVTCGANAFNEHQTHGWQLKRPIEFKNDDGEVVEFDDDVLKAVLNKALLSDVAAQAQAMDISFRPQDYLILLAIPHSLALRAASELVKMLLNTAQFGFKGVTVVRQPTLVLYSYDVTTGVVVDLGEQLSIVPVIDEFVVDDAIKMAHFGAPQIREQMLKGIGDDLQKMLDIFGNGSDNDDATIQLLLRYIVEKSCYVAADGIEEERKGIKDELVEFVGQHSLKVNGELRFMAPEGLFRPQLWGLEMPALHRMVHEAIQKCPIDSRRMLYRNVYLTGGTSLLRGLAERLEHELAQLAPASVLVQVLNSPWRRHSTFLGSHSIAASEDFEKCCVNGMNLAEYLSRIDGE